MSTPPYLCRGCSLFFETFNTPGAHELVDPFWIPGNLGIPFRAVDNFYPGGHRQLCKPVIPDQHLHFPGVGCDIIFDHPVRDIKKSLPGEVRDESRVCTVINHSGGRVIKVFCQLVKLHLAIVQGLFVRAGREYFCIGIPGFHRSVHVHDVIVMTPPNNLAAVNIPCKIDQQPSRRQVFGEDRCEIIKRDLPLEKAETHRSPRFQILGLILEIKNSDIFKRYGYMPEQDGERALGHRTISDNQNFISEFHYRPPGYR